MIWPFQRHPQRYDATPRHYIPSAHLTPYQARHLTWIAKDSGVQRAYELERELLDAKAKRPTKAPKITASLPGAMRPPIVTGRLTDLNEAAREYTYDPYPDDQDPSRALIEHAVRERLWRENTVQEQWAKLALQMGIGVAVIHDQDGIRHFQPHPDIPDRHFYHFPTQDAFDLYLEHTQENR